MRIVKDAEERKNEILDAAEELFGRKGFDKTSTNDILDRVGIARGTLYYHFKSKEDIMDALIERSGSRLMAAAKTIALDRSIPVHDRIVSVFRSLNISEEGGREIMEHIHRPQNALMHQKIQKVIINSLTPILAGIIRDGIEQGLFNTPYPYECMEMIVIYSNIVFDDDMVEISNEQMGERIEAFIFNLERMLGVEEGVLGYAMQIFNGENSSDDERH